MNNEDREFIEECKRLVASEYLSDDSFWERAFEIIERLEKENADHTEERRRWNEYAKNWTKIDSLVAALEKCKEQRDEAIRLDEQGYDKMVNLNDTLILDCNNELEAILSEKG